MKKTLQIVGAVAVIAGIAGVVYTICRKKEKAKCECDEDLDYFDDDDFFDDNFDECFIKSNKEDIKEEKIDIEKKEYKKEIPTIQIKAE